MKRLNIAIIDNAQSRQPPYIKRIFYMTLMYAMLFGPGILVDSQAMQWAGFVVLFFMGFMILLGTEFSRMTIDEARAKLDEIEKENETK